MEQILIRSPGGYEKLEIHQAPDPSVSAGHVVVRTRAIGVNYADVTVRWGLYESAKKYVGWPITPGFEFSGTVEKVGEGVQRFRVGDQVFGISFFGAYSSSIAVPDHQVYKLPKQLSFEQAAGFPAVFMTAYHALFQKFIVRPGMSILVHSAAGGVGSALLQLSRAYGLRAIGVVGSPHKVDVARRLGAVDVIDKSREDLWTRAEALAPEGYDVILDANGVATLGQSYRHLRATGVLVCYGFHTMLPRSTGLTKGRINWLKLAWNFIRTPRFNALDMTNMNRSVAAFNLSFLFSRKDLLEEGFGTLLKWLEEGKIEPPAVTTYPFHKVADAHRDLESGQTTGKLVLVL